MSLSLRKFFKKKTVDETPVAPAPLEKPASERLGRTVRPNVVRAIEPETPATFAAPIAPALPPAPAAPPARRTVSLGENSHLPALPKIPEPEPLTPVNAERTVALRLHDLLPQIPNELLAASQVDPAQEVVFSARELEHGMANGRPAVPLRAIYQQAPGMFAHEVAPGDEREVTLPFDQVLLQFANFQIRNDQVSGEKIPEMATPFSQIAVEDNQRFETPTLPTAPATIVLPHAPAAPPPPREPIRLTIPPISLPPVAPPTPPNELPEAAPSPAAELSPNGTGAPATERVPASSGSPVPISLPAPFAPPPPARIPFKITPPASDLCPPPELPVLPAATKPLVFSDHGPRIRLSLRAIFRELPPFQFTGKLEEIPASAEIELPFAIVEPQLPLGKVAISPAQFHAAMPEEFRAFFHLDDGGLPVPLPLAEVLQHLPNESLKLRSDQEETAVIPAFETPFSQKAAEDAARFDVPAEPIAKNLQTFAEPEVAAAPVVESAAEAPVAAPAEPEAQTPVLAPAAAEPEAAVVASAEVEQPPAVTFAEPARAVAVEPEPAVLEPEPETVAAIERTPLQAALDTDDTVDAKSVVAHVSGLAGVNACAVVFSDGLSLAGNLPPEFEADALCAMAPEILKRINEQMIGAHLGALHGVTLFCEKTPVSLFAQANICLVALHREGQLARETRAHLDLLTAELARIYQQPPNA